MDNSLTTARLFTGAPILAALALIGGFSALKSDQLSLSLTPSMAARHAIVAPGATERLAVAITANRSVTHRFIHFEVYDVAGRRVWQAWHSPVTLLHGISHTVTAAWPVSRALAPGRYTLRATVVAPSGGAEVSAKVDTIAVGR